jgi:lipoprotein
MKILNHKYSLLLITVICLFSVGCKTDREKKNVTFEKDSSSIYELIMKGKDIYIQRGNDDHLYVFNEVQLHDLFKRKYKGVYYSYVNFKKLVFSGKIFPNFHETVEFEFYLKRIYVNRKIEMICEKGGYKKLLDDFCSFDKSSDTFIMNIKTEEEAYNIAYYLSRYGFTYYFDDMTGKHILRHDR